MATVLEECTTVVHFLGEKGLIAKHIYKKRNFLLKVGSVCHIKRFTSGSRRFLKDEEVRKWVRQQSKDFYAAGFDVVVKRWDKCINVGGGYIE
jgi:hypothetical protein